MDVGQSNPVADEKLRPERAGGVSSEKRKPSSAAAAVSTACIDPSADMDAFDEPDAQAVQTGWRRHLVNVPVFASLFLGHALNRIGLRRSVDGWRRATEVGTRSEASKFALAMLGLDLWSDDPLPSDVQDVDLDRAEEHFILRFAKFLRSEPLARMEMIHERSRSYAQNRRHVDVSVAAFGPTGELLSIRPYWDSSLATPKPREELVRERILPQLLRSFNDLRDTWDVCPLLESDYIPAELDGSPAAPGAARAYIKRTLSATFISFERFVPGAPAQLRFVSPDFQLRRSPGLGPLNVVCRLSHDGRTADVWVQVHHAAMDGAPVQEMMTRLKRTWGVVEDRTVFPVDSIKGDTSTTSAATTSPVSPRPCSTPKASTRVSAVQDFIDFAPVLALRKSLVERDTIRMAGGAPVAALLIWAMAHQPAMAGKKFAVTVDVPVIDERPRRVGLVCIRPGEYFETLSKAAAFAAFVHEFNRLLNATRAGRGPVCRALDAMALASPSMQTLALRNNPDRTAQIFGTIGLSILRDVPVFIAPSGDLGFTDGFIAIGDMNVPTTSGGSVGAVSIKGASATQINAYSAAIREAIGRATDYV